MTRIFAALAVAAASAAAAASSARAAEGVVFESLRSGDAELWWSQLDGGAARQLTDTPGVDVQPAVSPDGRTLAFMSRRSGEPRIWTTDIHGANARMVSSGPGSDQRPAWSPDGRQLAFVSDRGGASGQIQVMNADGSGVRALTSSAGANGAPAWSPDGRRIAFLSTRDAGADGDRTGEVYVMDADGANQRNVSQRPGGESAPAWTLDGKGLVFGRDAGGLWQLRLDDGTLSQLTDGPRDANPSMTSSGTLLYDGVGADPDGGDVDVLGVRGDAGSPLRITTTAGRDADPAWAPVETGATTGDRGPTTTAVPAGPGASGGTISGPAAADLRRARIVPRRFTWAGRGKATLVLEARRRTTVTVTVQQPRRGPAKKLRTGPAVRLRAGTTRVSMRTLLGSRRLKPGAYDVALVVRAAPKPRVLVPFTLLR